MSRLGSLIGRKPIVEPTLKAAKPDAPQDRDDNVLDLDPELFAPIASQLGKNNEAVRSLLVDAEHRIGELDAVKAAITRLVEPVSKTLRDFEIAKSERLSLQTVLNTTRVAYGKLRNNMATLEKRAEILEAECARMQEDLSIAQEYVASLETAKAEMSAELTAKGNEIADLQRRIQHDAAALQNTREENRRITERNVASDKKTVQLEAETEAARQKATLAERERVTLQASLDEMLSEQARASRRLAEADNALTVTSNRLRQLESALAAAEAERTRLAQLSDEANVRYQNEISTQRMRYDALQTRAGTTEKLLDEARAALAARADELRAYERRMTEATLVRNMIEGKLGQIESGIAERDAQIRDVEHARAALAERTEVLSKAVATRETAYNRAQEKIGALEERIEQLEAELRGARESAELQAEELNTQLHRERVERTMAEGALESARKEVARMMREVAGQQHRPAALGLATVSHLPPAPNLRVA
jgi:crescentin